MTGLTDAQWAQIQRLLVSVPWTCEHCQREQHTPELLWDWLKFALVCPNCHYMQDYPGHLRAIDPHPPETGGAAA